MAMGKGTKILLIILGVFVALCVGGGVAMWKYVGQYAYNGIQAGGTFGLTTDNAGCVTNALQQDSTGQGFRDIMTDMTFLVGCLQKSKATPGFCDNVPAPADTGAVHGWIEVKCPVVEDARCRRTYSGVQSYCYSRTRSMG
jgi:hypothetical protein